MHAVKPTWQQRKVLQKAGFDPHVWYVVKVKKDCIEIRNTQTGETASVPTGS